MRILRLRMVAIVVVALCSSTAALEGARACGADEPTAKAAKVVHTSQVQENGDDDDRAKCQHLLLATLNGHDGGEFENPPVLRRIRLRQHRNRQLQKTESLVSWLFESARGYWNFEQERKRHKKESEEKENRDGKKG